MAILWQISKLGGKFMANLWQISKLGGKFMANFLNDFPMTQNAFLGLVS